MSNAPPPADIDLPRAADLPAWMQALRDRYLHTQTTQFVVHGNVDDAIWCAGRRWSITDFFDAFFAPSRKLVVHYDPGQGIRFPNEDHAVRAAKALCARGFIAEAEIAPRGFDKMPPRLIAEKLAAQIGRERDPQVALEVLEELLLAPGVPTAIIIHYAELIAPDGSPASLGFEERTAAARLHRWSTSDAMAGGDNLVVMLTAALPDLARRITRNPRVGSIQVPLPSAVERARFLAHLQPGIDPDRGEQLTRITAGLQLRQIHDIVAAHDASARDAQPDLGPSASSNDPRSVFAARPAATSLPLEAIWRRKKQVLEQECHGLIEVIEPDHGFDAVGGMGPIKSALSRVSAHVKAGRFSQVPMGILFVGPMGTGKTFVAEAFAAESGLSAVKLKNFRDKWVGSTEANLEKVLSVIEGLGDILVMIDEGDRSLGGQGEGDGGVDSRVMARLKEFMSDTSHRGRIIFVMMTNRPDKLDIDMKRPGRFDLKIPFFCPQNATERMAMVRAVLRRNRIAADLPDEALLPVLEPLEGYAAADLEALALMAYDDWQGEVLPEGVTERPEVLTAAYVAQAAHDFMPTRETAMIRYMELLAVQEASNRRLLPAQFADIEVSEVNLLLAEARAALPARA